MPVERSPRASRGDAHRGPGGSYSPDDHEKRHCKGFRRDAVDQGLQRAGEGAHRLGNHLPCGVVVGERPTSFRGRDAARTQAEELMRGVRPGWVPLHTQRGFVNSNL